jgi:hypothetical protein
MEENFRDIDMIFGADCPICGVNMKMFWCEFACNPRQHELRKHFDSLIVRPHNIIKIKHGGQYYDALNVTFRMSIQSSCEIYRSCDKVPETQMMASNGQGFLQFQVPFLPILT